MGWTAPESMDRLDVLTYSLDMGISRIDTADVYGLGEVETLVGTALRGRRREEIEISTKVGYWGPSLARDPYAVRPLVDACLKRLQTTYIDLLNLHNHEVFHDRHTLNIVAGELAKLQGEGAIRAVGIRGPHQKSLVGRDDSDLMNAILDAIAVLDPSAMTVRINPLVNPSRELSDLCEAAQSRGVRVRVSKPLAQGLVVTNTGSATDRPYESGDLRLGATGFSPEARATADTSVRQILRKLGYGTHEATAVMVAYARAVIPGCEPIVGCRSRTQVEALARCADIELTADEVGLIRTWGQTLSGQLRSR